MRGINKMAFIQTINKTKKGLWYFAHPYTVMDHEKNFVLEGQEANFKLCCMRSAELIKRGYVIYSPITHTHPIHMSDPEFIKQREYLLWIDLDNEIINATKWKGIILAPKWEESRGCRDEYNMFKSKNLLIKLYEHIIRNEKQTY